MNEPTTENKAWTERSRERYEEYLRKYWAPTGLRMTHPPLTRETMAELNEVVKERMEKSW